MEKRIASIPTRLLLAGGLLLGGVTGCGIKTGDRVIAPHGAGGVQPGYTGPCSLSVGEIGIVDRDDNLVCPFGTDDDCRPAVEVNGCVVPESELKIDK